MICKNCGAKGHIQCTGTAQPAVKFPYCLAHSCFETTKGKALYCAKHNPCECGSKDVSPDGHSSWCKAHSSSGTLPFVLKDYKGQI